MFVKDLAIKNADTIKSGVIDEYQVLLPNSNKQVEVKSLAFLGSTTRFSYLFDVQNSQAIVIPVENVEFMSKNIAPNPEVEAPKQEAAEATQAVEPEGDSK